MKETRNKINGWVLTVILSCGLFFGNIFFIYQEASAATSAPDIKIGVAYPLSGPYSRNGNLMVQGAKAAIGWVNDNGGIKSLGGAKLVPVIVDTGSSVEGAASAVERLCRDPEIVMVIGCWSSSLTLAATEVTERLGIPHFSISFVDALSERGFKWGFYTHMPVSRHGELGVGNIIRQARADGYEIKTAMLLGDNMSASMGLYKSSKTVFKREGIKLLDEEHWSPGTLADATPVMQKVRSMNPDLVVWNPSAISEAQMLLMKRKEMGIKVPFASGAMLGDSSFRQLGDGMDGIIIFSPSWPSKKWPQDWIDRTLNQVRKDYSNELWVGQELAFPWTLIPIMAAILEKAGSTDHEKIWEVAHEIDLHGVPATQGMMKQGIAFDKTGRIVEKYQELGLIQWQRGTPVMIYPPDLAVAKPVWPKKK
jgi:branched-chain amino acid transport system substrate-binding protein